MSKTRRLLKGVHSTFKGISGPGPARKENLRETRKGRLVVDNETRERLFKLDKEAVKENRLVHQSDLRKIGQIPIIERQIKRGAINSKTKAPRRGINKSYMAERIMPRNKYVNPQDLNPIDALVQDIGRKLAIINGIKMHEDEGAWNRAFVAHRRIERNVAAGTHRYSALEKAAATRTLVGATGKHATHAFSAKLFHELYRNPGLHFKIGGVNVRAPLAVAIGAGSYSVGKKVRNSRIVDRALAEAEGKARESDMVKLAKAINKTRRILKPLTVSKRKPKPVEVELDLGED